MTNAFRPVLYAKLIYLYGFYTINVSNIYFSVAASARAWSVHSVCQTEQYKNWGTKRPTYMTCVVHYIYLKSIIEIK